MKLYNKKEQVVGELAGNVYHSHRTDKHFMRKFRGFGISLEIIEILIKKGCTDVIIHYNGKNAINYGCPLNKYKNSKMTFNFEEEDMQHFVPVADMINLTKTYLNDPDDYLNQKKEVKNDKNTKLESFWR